MLINIFPYKKTYFCFHIFAFWTAFLYKGTLFGIGGHYLTLLIVDKFSHSKILSIKV